MTLTADEIDSIRASIRILASLSRHWAFSDPEHATFAWTHHDRLESLLRRATAPPMTPETRPR